MGNFQRWRMYNSEKYENAKELFLETQFKNENSRQTYRITLGNISEHERFLGKDIFNQSWNEVKETFETLTTNTLATVSTTKSRIAKYIEWAISNNLSESNMVLGLLKNCNDEDLVSITAMENQYITEEEKDRLIDYSRNYQDKAFIMLLFKGVGGVELSEITGLRFSDLNFDTNEIHLHGKVKKRDEKTGKTVEAKGERTIKLTEDEMNMLELAYKTSTFWVYKAKTRDITKDRNWVAEPLMENGYIFRKKERSNNVDTYSQEIRAQILTSRLKTLVKDEGYEGIGLQKPQIVVKTLNTSGMLHQLKKLRATKKQITDDDFREIVKQYNSQEYGASTLKKLYNFMVKRGMKFVKIED